MNCGRAESTCAKVVTARLGAAATALAFVSPWISYALFVVVAVIWFVPDRRLADR